MVGNFMEGLLNELPASQTMVNPKRFAAAFGDGSDSGMRLHLNSGLPARTIGAESSRQAGEAGLAGTGKTVEHIVVGVLSESFGDTLIELLNGPDQRT